MNAHRWLVILLTAALLAGCGSAGSGSAGTDGPVAVTSINILGDLVRQVAGDRVRVKSLLGPGQDPHTYEPVPRDSIEIEKAGVVFINGLGLDFWAEKLIQGAGGQRQVVRLAEGASVDRLPWEGGGGKQWDPHLWMDPVNVIQYVEQIRAALAELDPAGAETFQANAERLTRELEALDTWIKAEIGLIPPDKRKLITTHDAYRYFGRRYGFQVLDTVWGVSTEEEPSAQDIAGLIDTLREHQVPAFVETTINPQIMEQATQQAGVPIGGQLYGDALGGPGSGAETYVTMMRHNVNTIVAAFTGG